MKGSSVTNIKFDSKKQKIVICDGCGTEIIIGKFAKKTQRCEKCKNVSTNRKNRDSTTAKDKKFAVKFSELANKLGFTVNNNRIWRKRYAINEAGIITIHLMIEPGRHGNEPKLEYFSMVIQRAIGLNEDFRKFLPPDAASDCEILASELGEEQQIKPQLGMEKCDGCGSMTDEFGVDNKRCKLLCIKPNNCFKKSFTTGGAEGVE